MTNNVSGSLLIPTFAVGSYMNTGIWTGRLWLMRISIFFFNEHENIYLVRSNKP